jgi:hypothetical protein
MHEILLARAAVKRSQGRPRAEGTTAAPGRAPDKQTISVRGGTKWQNADQHAEMSVSEIDAVAEEFLKIEAELYKLKAPLVTAIITVSPERADALLPEVPPEED